MNRDRSSLCVAITAAILMGGCAPPPASSEPQKPVLAVDQVAGVWALRGPSGARCRVSLANLLIDGVRPVLLENCGVAAVAGARTWRATADGFHLLAADGALVMGFRRTGEDAFEAASGGLIMSRAPLS